MSVYLNQKVETGSVSCNPPMYVARENMHCGLEMYSNHVFPDIHFFPTPTTVTHFVPCTFQY